MAQLYGFDWKEQINEAKKAKKKNNKPLNKPMRSSSGGKAYKVYVKDPKTGNIKVLKSLISPVTNLWNSLVGNDCEVFYDGSVEHPK